MRLPRPLCEVLARFCYRFPMTRAPDVTLGPGFDPYLARWHLIPRNRLANVYLHMILRDDRGRCPHDHPWWNCSIVLRGAYRETGLDGRSVTRRQGSIVTRRATDAHRLIVREPDLPGFAVTLFITGPRVREWGFHTPSGWVHHADYGGEA